LSNVSMWVDYIFLDTDERKEFAQKPHEYLIETVQTQETTLAAVTAPQNVRLTFNHPTKLLAWVARDITQTTTIVQNTAQNRNGVTNVGQLGDKFTNFTCDANDTYTYDLNVPLTDFITTGSAGRLSSGRTGNIATSLLQLNGQDRFAARSGHYFDTVQPFQHFSSRPDVGINVYSFAVKPEEHQPSGTCNFSRIDNANLVLTLNPNKNGGGGVTATSLSVYALSYNVFRVASGMGGLAYSN
jgi:hypothetical protein